MKVVHLLDLLATVTIIKTLQHTSQQKNQDEMQKNLGDMKTFVWA